MFYFMIPQMCMTISLVVTVLTLQLGFVLFRNMCFHLGNCRKFFITIWAGNWVLIVHIFNVIPQEVFARELFATFFTEDFFIHILFSLMNFHMSGNA